MKKLSIALIFFSSLLSSAYIYESNQSLFNLTNQASTTNLNSGDDQLSAAFNLDFTFDFYGSGYSSARMATNGCLHFGLGTGNINYNNYCGDYTPDPLPQYTNTLFPFWTDLIRDNNSKMLAKNFSDKTVFGWYNMREYNRSGSDNSFEVVLWTNDTFEFRYGGLNINKHDVLIGEQGSSSQTYTYLFYDECSTGTTNIANTCSSVDWNNSIQNNLLENGGSLYGIGSGNGTDCSDPLNDPSCSGYAAAYLSQQCNIDALYSESCPFYWDAFDDQQCNLDPQYAPFCAGYRFEQDVGYFLEEEEFDYGFVDEQELMATGIFVEEEYQPEIIFYTDPTRLTFQGLEEPEPFQDIFLETDTLPELYPEELIALIEFQDPIDILLRPEITFEVIEEPPEEVLIFESIEELEAFIEEETVPFIVEELREEIRQEERIEAEEERVAEVEELFEEIFEEELELEPEDITEAVVGVATINEKSGITKTQLNVVAATMNVAKNSVSGPTAGTDVNAKGTNSSSGNVSMSNQMQTNMSLNIDMGLTNTTLSANIKTESIDSTTSSTSTEDSIGVDSNKSEADTIADNIIAKNLEQQAEETMEERNSGSLEYGNEEKIIAYINFVPGFSNYSKLKLPNKKDWYTPKSIYIGNKLSDNNNGFNTLALQSIQTLNKLKLLQPNL